MIWAEVSKSSQAWRFGALSRELQECGLENTLYSVAANEQNLAQVVDDLRAAHPELTQIRFDEALTGGVPNLTVHAPAWLHAVKCSDTLALDLGSWWPHNFLYEGVLTSVAREFKELDLSAGVFLAGASCEARSFVFALSRVGFNTFNIMDPDESRAQAMVADLRKNCFGAKFLVTQKNRVTQLPAVCSVGVNTLSLVEHPTLLDELYYLNFLKGGGVWIETKVTNSTSPLIAEAVGLGAFTYSPIELMSQVDSAWAESSFKIKIDLLRYRKNLNSSFTSAHTGTA